MVSKHFKWQVRWKIDAEALEARHDCGFVVRFVPDGQGLRAAPKNRDSIIAALTPKNGHNAPTMVARMLREAEQLMTEAVRRG